jgi:hypothetical protein
MKRTLLLGKVLGFNSNKEEALKRSGLVDLSKTFICSQTGNFLSSSYFLVIFLFREESRFDRAVERALIT